jgi:hypothetical protein
MADIVLAGNTSGTVTLSAPDVAGTTTLNLPASSGTVITTASTDTANALNAGLGVNQTWQSVTRTSGVTYTNTSGKPISLHVTALTSTNNVLGTITISINSGAIINLARAGGGAVAQTVMTGFIIIPNTFTYVMTHTNVTSVSYNELR